jgi:hypothetical protein
MVEVKALVDSVNDGAVLYLLADCALEACRTQEIGVEAFESWTDKEKVAQILDKLITQRKAYATRTGMKPKQLGAAHGLISGMATSTAIGFRTGSRISVVECQCGALS